MTDLAGQLADELDRAIVGPVVALLGVDLGMDVAERCRAVAPGLAAQMTHETDDKLVAQTVIDLMCALWPMGAPEQVGRADWWGTPLGRVCAQSLGRDDSESVTRSVAAAMLGVTPGTVAQLVHRGTLARHPAGGVARSSVLARITRLRP